MSSFHGSRIMSRQRLSNGIMSYGVDKIVTALVQLLMVPVLAHAWGLSLFGIWAMMMTVPAFLVLGDFGIVAAAGARMTRLIGRGEWAGAQVVLHTATLATLAICLALALVVGAVLWFLPAGYLPSTPNFAVPEARLTLLLLLAYGLVAILFRLNTAAYRSALHYTLAIWCSMGTYALENVGVIVAVALGAGPVEAAATLLALRLAAILIVMLLSLRRFPALSPGFHHARAAELAQLWRPALAASVLGFGMATYLQGSVVLLGTIAGAAAVPAFVAVRTISRLGTQMSTLVSIPVAQEFGNALAQDDTRRAGRLFALVAVPALAMAITMSLGFAVLGQAAIRVWTAGAIEPEVGLVLFMAASSFAAILWNPLSNLILVINRQSVFSYANLAASAAGLLIIYGLASRLGSISAGVSFMIVDAVTLICVALFIFRTWLVRAPFRAGFASTVAEFRSPRVLLRSIRAAPTKGDGQ